MSRDWWNPKSVPECIECDNEGCEDCHEWAESDDCGHEWMLRPEHDDWICLFCQAER